MLNKIKSTRNINEIKNNFEAINKPFYNNFKNRKEYKFLYDNLSYYDYNNLENNWNIIGLKELKYFVIDIIEYELHNTEIQKQLYVVINKVNQYINVSFYIFDKNNKDIKTSFEYDIMLYDDDFHKLKTNVYQEIEKNVVMFVKNKNLVW